MNNNPILGTNYVLWVDRTTDPSTPIEDVVLPGDFKMVACLQNNGFDGTRDQIDTSSKCSGLFKDSIPGQLGWTMSGDGNIIIIDLDDDRVGANELNEMLKTGETALFGIFDEEQSQVIYGYGYVSAFSVAYPNNANSTFNITIQGKGEYLIATGTT